MELDEIKYKFIVDLAKFFISKYKTKELKSLDLVVNNIKAMAPFIQEIGYTFDESIWFPTKPKLYNNLIEFKVQLRGQIAYLPFRLYVNKGFSQKPILLKPGTMEWDWTI